MQTTEEVRLRFLLPSMAAVSARPFQVISTFITLSILTAVLAPEFWDSIEVLRIVAIGTTTTIIAGAGTVGVLNRPPRKPKEPRRQTVRYRSPGRRPSPTIPRPVHRCLICNRPLKDPTSMRAGVGPDCRARYGARPQHQPNPAFASWEQRAAQLRREGEQRQRGLDAQHAQAMQAYQNNLRLWQTEMVNPTNVARTQARRVATRTVAVDVGVLISFLLSAAVGDAVDRANLPSLF